jgi:hypothetical protein
MYKERISRDDALIYLLQQREEICPNVNFAYQLKQWEYLLIEMGSYYALQHILDREVIVE